MNKRVLVIASVVGLVFLFAGYNLYSYFQTQAEIAAQEERLAEERRLERERERAERAAEKQAEQERLAAERKAEEERRAAERAAESERKEQERLAAEAQRQAERDAAEQRDREREAERLAKKIEAAREVPDIEGMDEAELRELRAVSPRYLRENPQVAAEVFTLDPNVRRYGGQRRFFKDQSTYFMMLSAACKNPEALKAALDAGADINAANVEGYTALMFAAAYNSADIVTFLIENGADISATASKFDLNALHIAALMNPHPDVVEALVKGGFDIEGETGAGDTPLVAAALNTRNLEVVQRLVELGADKTAYAAENGLTAHGIVSGRLEQRDRTLRRISEAYERATLQELQ
jgi:hypothetical protein